MPVQATSIGLLEEDNITINVVKPAVGDREQYERSVVALRLGLGMDGTGDSESSDPVWQVESGTPSWLSLPIRMSIQADKKLFGSRQPWVDHIPMNISSHNLTEDLAPYTTVVHAVVGSEEVQTPFVMKVSLFVRAEAFAPATQWGKDCRAPTDNSSFFQLSRLPPPTSQKKDDFVGLHVVATDSQVEFTFAACDIDFLRIFHEVRAVPAILPAIIFSDCRKAGGTLELACDTLPHTLPCAARWRCIVTFQAVSLSAGRPGGAIRTQLQRDSPA